MQNEITGITELLDSRGNIAEPGWARNQLYRYSRSAVKVPAWRIKEWDYYCILNGSRGIALTAADNGYMGFFSASVINTSEGRECTSSAITPFPLGRIGMPSSSETGDVNIKTKQISLSFRIRGETRYLDIDYPGFCGGEGLKGSAVLRQIPDSDSMVIATPFKKRGHFYYNRKINCMSAEGSFKKGDSELAFGDGTYGVLDWGRGVWTYKNTWYWASASGTAEGVPFGFNLGYGFGDTSAATENLLFYNGRGHKLHDVSFGIPAGTDGKERYMDPWHFTSSDSRLDLEFHPAVDRFSDTNLFLIRSLQHQVFGTYTGYAVLDSGKRVEIKNLPGFAEKVFNKW